MRLTIRKCRPLRGRDPAWQATCGGGLYRGTVYAPDKPSAIAAFREAIPEAVSVR